jgi:excinuclease UvrABC nuclease subunit
LKVDQLNPRPAQKLQFRLSSYKYVPKTSGCYVLTTFDENILYIGLTDSFFDRFQQHLNNPEKTNQTKNGKAVWFYFTEYDTNNLPRLERTWLNQYASIHGELPILNKVSSPIK